jgi:signal transduction histidine kinase
MKRRSKAGGKSGKAGHQKAATPKRRHSPPKAVRRRAIATSQELEIARLTQERDRLLSELRQRTDDLTEAQEQQAATSEILRVISTSPTDTRPVFETIVCNAVSLCDSLFANVFRYDGELIHWAASHNVGPSYEEILRAKYPMRPDLSQISGRVLLSKSVVWLEDALVDPDYDQQFPKTLRWRRVLGVPMLRDGEPLGVIVVAWSEPGPVSKVQEELLKTFADQAVIAIENVRLFGEIEDKSRQLAEASQHKSQFLANMSHELRTPLNAILGYTELMADGVYGAPPENMSAVLKRIESNGKHLLSLINAVLDLSKIEAGQLKLDLADYSLANVVLTVHSMVQPLAADKKLTFKTEVTPTLPPGHGDERRLTQVLLNLVGNAIKFTEAREVVIKAAASDGLFALSVRDTGSGISTADQTKLFQEFQQVDNSITRKKGGTGLGLAISKRIVEMHGGKIWLESQVGQGSTFFVTLPVRAEQQTQSN